MAENKENRQRRPFKRKRAGVVLTKDEVRSIKQGRKKLRREMRQMGIKSKKEFELTASGLGLYFDKNKRGAGLLWFLLGKGGWILLGAGLVLIAALYAFSLVTELKGHFTISLSDELFKQGFTLSETADFNNPTGNLFATPATEVPCISVLQIPEDIAQQDGSNNQHYFAYTFYIRNEGDAAAGYDWQLNLNAQTKNLSEAAWIMVFENDKMAFYAKAGDDGQSEMLPAAADNTRGYEWAPLRDQAKDPDAQYEIIENPRFPNSMWRIKPIPFVSDTVLIQDTYPSLEPMQVTKYTVVIWLEGDDPDCTDELIGGYMGLDLRITMIEE